ncbi:MAG: hypothetical protein AAF570_02790 [Bacteroidota bacterium]
MLLILGFVGWQMRKSGSKPAFERGDALLWCGAEELVEEGEMRFFRDGKWQIHTAAQVASDWAHTGASACRTDTVKRVAFEAEVRLAGNRVYEVGVWRKSPHGYGRLDVRGLKGFKFSVRQADGVAAGMDGWEQLAVTVRVPPTHDSVSLRITAHHNSEFAEVVWFDDLTIRELHGERAGPCTPELRAIAQRDPVPDLSLAAYHVAKYSNQAHILLHSYHPFPLRIVAHAPDIDARPRILGQAIQIPSADSLPQPVTQNLLLPNDTRVLFFTPEGETRMLPLVIDALGPPGLPTTRQKLLPDSLISHPIYTLENRTVTFQPGKHVLRETLGIPPGFQVLIPAGTHIDFVNGAGLISASPVTVAGTATAPVRFSSSDSSAKGFTVLADSGQSHLRYFEVTNFRALDHGDWLLTGAVTLHGHDVQIDHLYISDNRCEDALNLVRCSFKIDSLKIQGTASDGFDADFCAGYIKDSEFLDTGNDGMDFSGSEITVTNVNVNRAGDKGLSVGEDSEVVISDLQIQQAVIGVASKDLSQVEAKSLEVHSCKVAFSAYQKKPEFGPAKIIVHKAELKGNERRAVADPGSAIEFRN